MEKGSWRRWMNGSSSWRIMLQGRGRWDRWGTGRGRGRVRQSRISLGVVTRGVKLLWTMKCSGWTVLIGLLCSLAVRTLFMFSRTDHASVYIHAFLCLLLS